MDTFQNTVTIGRPAEEVFAFLADAENVPRWNYAIEQTRKISPGPPGAGTIYHQTRTIPRRSQESFQVTAFQPPSLLAIDGTIGPFQARATYLPQATASGTRLTNNVELEPLLALLRPVAGLAVPTVKAAVARNLRTLKRVLENPGPAIQAAWH